MTLTDSFSTADRAAGRGRLAAEALLLFGAPPAALLALHGSGVQVRAVPAILAALVVFGALIARDRSFGWRTLLGWRAPGSAWARVLGTSALGAVGLLLVARAVAPDDLLRLPTERPGRWLAILASYPLLSVVPQEILFRAFFCHRYRGLFASERGLWIASALAFGWAHALFGHPLSVVLSTVGGLLFGWTWLRTRSLLLVSVEHALLGAAVFTVGLHRYFLSGA